MEESQLHPMGNGEAVLMSLVLECPYKFIKGWCLGLNSSYLVSKHRHHVFFASTRYSRNELKDTDRHDVVSFSCPLILTFSIPTVKYEFDFDVLPCVTVIPPSGDNIIILFLMFLTGKANSMVSMPIVFVEQCKTPVRTNFFSSIPISNNLPDLFKGLLRGHEASL